MIRLSAPQIIRPEGFDAGAMPVSESSPAVAISPVRQEGLSKQEQLARVRSRVLDQRGHVVIPVQDNAREIMEALRPGALINSGGMTLREFADITSRLSDVAVSAAKSRIPRRVPHDDGAGLVEETPSEWGIPSAQEGFDLAALALLAIKLMPFILAVTKMQIVLHTHPTVSGVPVTGQGVPIL